MTATSQTEVKVGIETITPARAAKDLARKAPNRNISNPTALQYAADMNADKFMLNGESIIYDALGRLMDGEHRLSACVRANRPFRTVVVYGIDPAAHSTIDIGRKRSVGDTLRIHGCTYYIYVAGGIRWLRLMDQGQLSSTGDIRVTPEEALVMWLANREKMDRAAYAGRSVSRIFSPSMATALYYRLSEKDPDQAQKFFVDLATGAGLDLQDPVLLLRQRLLANRSDRRRTLSSPETLTLVIRAWNLRRQGKGAKLLRGSTSRADKGGLPAPI